jgi:hypothetical protein
MYLFGLSLAEEPRWPRRIQWPIEPMNLTDMRYRQSQTYLGNWKEQEQFLSQKFIVAVIVCDV